MSWPRSISTIDGVMWVSLALLVVYTAVAGTGVLYGADYAIIVASQIFANGLFDAVGNLLSAVGDVEVVSVVFGLFCIWMFFFLDRWLAVRLVGSYFAASMVELVMKLYVPVPVMPSELGRTGTYDPTIDVSYSYPYPSGHMLRIVIALGTLYILWPNRMVRGVIIAVFALMAATRVYLGVHWLSDMIGGLLLGLVALAWSFRSYDPKSSRKGFR